VALVLAEEQGRVRAEGVSDGSLVAAPEARAYFAGYRSGQSSDDSNSFNYEVGRGWAQAAGATDADALPLGNARFQGAGRLTLFLDGPEGRVEADGQSLSYRTGNETEQSSGLAMTGKHVRRFIVLHLEGAAFDTGPGSGAILAAPRVDVRVDGAFAGSGVAGYARVGKDRWDLDHVDVRAEGAFSASVAWAQASLPVPVAQEGPEGVVEGDATSVWIDGLRVGAPAPTALERLEPALAVVLLGLLVALLKTGAFWSFYSRIADADVLANENRRAIYQLLQKGFRGPITSVAKSVGVSVAVAAYHARLLQARGLVVSAREGRVRVLGAAAGGRLAEDVRAELALKVDRRRRIASAVASASGGLTQAEIVSRTGDSQRLVSHHLALLVELGLLVRNDGRPARYVATDALQSRALGEKRAEASAGTTAASVG
jgi:predicted transcriptional regulator